MKRLVTFFLLFSISTLAEDLLDFDLEDLVKMHVKPVGTLTKTEERRIPAAITRISREMIKKSGARSLEELLEIYIPNFQTLRHHFAGTNVGFRGILTDLNDKILLLVNGRVMNHRMFYGADSEFKLSLLGDIHHIDVVRGPGSATYGPGAISGVISIHTLNSRNFSGTELSFKQGFLEEFSSFEMKVGQKLDDSSGYFLYAGGDIYQGSDHRNSPLYFGTSINGRGPNSNTGINWTDDRQSFRGRPRLKLHLEYNVENFDFWLRYTQGGHRETGVREYSSVSNRDEYVGIGYQQFTAAARYKSQLSKTLEIDLLTSYDMYNRFRRIPYISSNNTQLNFREDEIYFRLQMNWTPDERHQIAYGLDFSYEFFGRNVPGWPHQDSTPVPGNSPWETSTLGVFGEHQWRLSEDLTNFFSLRLDKHSYSELMFSPRWALVYTPTEYDTFKFIYNRSVRRTNDFFLRTEYLNTGDESDDTETLDNLELRYEKQLNERLSTALSINYSVLEVIAFDGTTNISNSNLGKLSLYGAEWEAKYKSEKLIAILSHGWTQMHDFSLDRDVTSQVVSAHPYGFGKNLAHWSNHISKLYLEYKLSKKWLVNSSTIYYWGYPGAEDYADYNNARLQQNNITRTEGSKKAFGRSIFVNAGVQYKPDKHWTIHFNAHNVLGWFDKDFNKRNYLQLMDTYRLEAPAFSFSIDYRF